MIKARTGFGIVSVHKNNVKTASHSGEDVDGNIFYTEDTCIKTGTVTTIFSGTVVQYIMNGKETIPRELLETEKNAKVLTSVDITVSVGKNVYFSMPMKTLQEFMLDDKVVLKEGDVVTEVKKDGDNSIATLKHILMGDKKGTFGGYTTTLKQGQELFYKVKNNKLTYKLKVDDKVVNVKVDDIVVFRRILKESLKLTC